MKTTQKKKKKVYLPLCFWISEVTTTIFCIKLLDFEWTIFLITFLTQMREKREKREKRGRGQFK